MVSCSLLSYITYISYLYIVYCLNLKPTMSRELKSKSQQFFRGKRTIFKKINKLVRLCDAEAIVVICKNGRYFTYQSRESWPPSWEEIVSLNHSNRNQTNSFREGHIRYPSVCFLRTSSVKNICKGL